MAAEDPDALADVMVSFVDVTIVRAAAPALLCRIGQRNVWLSRRDVAGKLWCAGDRGTLFLRYGLARELNLLGSLKASARYALEVSCARSERSEPLHLVRPDESEGKRPAHQG